jgi:hypothetical protein
MMSEELKDELVDKYYVEDAMCKSDLYNMLNEYDKRINSIESETENNQLPPLKTDCPKCGGKGIIDIINSKCPIPEDFKKCSCNNGKVWNYRTPEQYIFWMRGHGHPGYEMLDSDPVWHGIRFNNHIDWKINTYQKAYCSGFDIIIVAIQGQPTPPKDYRTEQ